MNISNPVISVIVPVYKAERYLNECIDSILAQTFSDLELILVDDGSPDRSGEICDQYAAEDSRIRVIHKQNGGVSSARNAGLDIAKGEWIAFVDADDMIAPDMLEKLLDKAEQDRAEIVTSDFKFLYSNNQTNTEHSFPWIDCTDESKANYIYTTKWTVVWGSIIKKNLFDLYNIRFIEGITWGEDFNVMIKLIIYADVIKHTDKTYYLYRQSDSSICHNLGHKDYASHTIAYEDVALFLERSTKSKAIKEKLAWRILLHTHPLVLDLETFDRFINIYPQKKSNILSCPNLNLKVKIIAWCLTHHMRPVSYAIVRLRKLCGR